MIEQQIRPWEVLDPTVLDTLRRIPRERFVPEDRRELAFADIQLSIGHGEVMMEPKIEARLVQELDLTGGEKVLEVGTGSGYVTALLACLAASVVSVEIYKDFSNRAAEKLKETGIGNVILEAGDASKGWPSTGGFDAIILTGSVPELPAAFTDALKPGGRLVAIVGSDPVMEAIRIEKGGEKLQRTSLFDTTLPPLVNAVAPRRFVF
ncbi:MAG: protein-L-isoaspartate O-methyltransferase [Proteobacteria bacterium]|nr:MAG: protein-L-isoaspartate O-methyltransferase [Pseudomonadota bacterium]